MSSALESALENACKLLELATPEAMDASVTALEGVAREFGERRASIGAAEARRLRAGARKARLLLDLAAGFHARWHDILAGMAVGYTAKGAPSELSPRTRISVSG